MTTTLNTQAPDFRVPDHEGNPVSLASLAGKKVVLYFYPKDDTPGCTQESKDFAQLNEAFDAAGALIFGVSRDDLKSHVKFRDKYCLPFPLLSDQEGAMCEAYGVWVQKSMYGKKYMGIERSTFVIDTQGVLRHEWRKVSVNGHAEQVLEAVKALA